MKTIYECRTCGTKTGCENDMGHNVTVIRFCKGCKDRCTTASSVHRECPKCKWTGS